MNSPASRTPRKGTGLWSPPVLLVATLAAVACAAGPARAQVASGGGRVSDALASGSDVQPSPSFSTEGLTPDTTSPWRYYPLEVGNVWEYENGPFIIQYRISQDTIALGNRYFILERWSDAAPGGPFFRQYVRFDTVTASIRQLTSSPLHVDLPADDIGCQFDAPFDSAVECEGLLYQVSGTYDGVVVFGGERAGTGTDTVRTATKRYDSSSGFETIFSADIGLVAEYGEGAYLALRYYRVGGVEGGYPLFPTRVEDAPRRSAVPALRTWPNPSGGRVTVGFTVERPETVRLTVRDLLGREVHHVDLGVLGRGDHEVRADLSGLAPGPYVIEVRGQAPLGVSVVVLGDGVQ
ncbi:hypothetical protein [Rubrivirga sp.]|uniref:hypothetical protein n=1 Tax=Rubrivirga sp. TaxID=1885344 RepID=UPI003B51897A